MSACRILLTILALLASAFVAKPAHAAESYDNCAGFIDSIPTTISTQGVWCLRKNLSTGITEGRAITVAANNVTIDCNDFKLGGLAGGVNSTAIGIRSYDRQNVTIRNCSIRGFFDGIYLNGGAGHLVEDNRLDNSLYIGIHVIGENSRVRRNAVYDTGGRPNTNISYGIQAWGDVTDNLVSGVFATAASTSPEGISAAGDGSQIRNNAVRGVEVRGADGYGLGITSGYSGVTIAGNRVTNSHANTAATRGIGITGGEKSFCIDNTVSGFDSAFYVCESSLGNLSN